MPQFFASPSSAGSSEGTGPSRIGAASASATGDPIDAATGSKTISPALLKGAGRRHAFGVTCVLLAALSASLTGILLRQVETANGWQILFYRSGAFALIFLVLVVLRHRHGTVGAFRAIGRPGLVAAVCLGGTFIAFIMAMLLTTVAAVVFVFSASPFLAALLGWLILRERVPMPTWIGMTVALW